MRASNKVKGAVLLTAGAALVLGAPTVYADTETRNNEGLLNGLQVLNGVSANVPVNACGVSAILASSRAECDNAAGNGNGGPSINSGKTGKSGKSGKVKGGSGGDEGNVSSRNNGGLLNGAQVGNNLTANVPVNACGVGAILGSGRGDCKNAAGNNNGGPAVSKGSHGSKGKSGGKVVGGNGADQGDVSSRNRDGLLNGLQALNNVSLNVPINVCGVGLLIAGGRGDCENAAGNGNGGGATGIGRHGNAVGGNGGEQGDVSSRNNGGLLNGLQLLNNLEANVPVNVCGVGLLLASGRGDCDNKAGNRNGGPAFSSGPKWKKDRDHDHDRKHSWKKWRHDHDSDRDHDRDHDSDSDHGSKSDEKRSWKSSALPHTGAAGLALIPFGLAMIAGGAAVRRRITSQR